PQEILAEIAQVSDAEITPFSKKPILNRLRKISLVNEYKQLNNQGRYVLFQRYQLILNALLQ
ncbi:unnamed protein product, partial [marine sediment metagenome]